jgi:hypothetical protein
MGRSGASSMKVYIIVRSNHVNEEWEIRRVYATEDQAAKALELLEASVSSSWTRYTLHIWEVSDER